MKVCFFAHQSISNRDGATLSMYNIIDEMSSKGIEVVVIIPNRNNLEERLKKTNAKYYYVPMYGMRMNLESITTITNLKFIVKSLYNNKKVKKIMSILIKEQVDLIHINGLDSPIGAMVAKRLRLPYIWHIRQFMDMDLGKKLFNERKTYQLVQEANAVIGISKDVKSKFEKQFGREVSVVYNGVPVEKYALPNHEILNENIITILLAGRISIQKGQMDAIKAIEYLVDKGYKKVHLILVGQAETKEYMNDILEYIKIHDLENYIDILEHTDNLNKLRSQSDIGLICSQKEAFGRVTVENMMGNLLVIGANSGGTPEIIDDNIDGLLYEVNNYKDLAHKIMMVCDERIKMKEIAKAGYNKALMQFSINRVVSDITRIYDDILN